ncbi:MAG: rod shape-determining protein MreD [Oscillospiraceae bacterium]|nr:rod shape-determining protein MreD [Oscillospiraceae bacterium]
MKIIKNSIYVIIWFLIIYFLQSSFFQIFTIAGVKPNLFIIFIIFVSLNTSKYYAMSIGIVVGLLIDFIIGNNIGQNAILYGLLGYIISSIRVRISKESRISNILIIFISTLCLETVGYIAQILFAGAIFEISVFIKIVLIEAVYNGIILMIIYPLWKMLSKSEVYNSQRAARYL